MRAVLVLVLAACGRDAPAPPAGARVGSAVQAQPADPSLRSVARPVPAGPYRVIYDCGPGNHQEIDLGAKTRTTSGTPAPVVSNLSDAMSSMIADTVTRVLAGGPYRAEPGPCSLAIETAGRAAVFTIEKSAHQEKDAVSDLVRVFVP
jgi:hypothetical protein